MENYPQQLLDALARIALGHSEQGDELDPQALRDTASDALNAFYRSINEPN